MNPNQSRIYPPAPNYEDEPPAYGYGETTSFLSDNESPPRRNGTTMRLLPTSGDVDSTLHSGGSQTYQYEQAYEDDAR